MTETMPVQRYYARTMELVLPPSHGPHIVVNESDYAALEEKYAKLEADNKRLEVWIDDLQKGMLAGCMYCGHRYGLRDKMNDTMRAAMQEHIEVCPQHPMAGLKQENAKLKAEKERLTVEVARLNETIKNYTEGIHEYLESLKVKP